MRKIVSFILAMVMLLTLAVPGLAATQPDETVAMPMHDCDYVIVGGPYIMDGGGIYVNNDTCRKRVQTFYACSICQHSMTETRVVDGASPHDGSVYDADCNGTTQTWYNRCVHCNGVFTTYEPCPKATHSGECQCLPC